MRTLEYYNYRYNLITFHGETYNLGAFSTAKEEYDVYVQKHLELHGEYSYYFNK